MQVIPGKTILRNRQFQFIELIVRRTISSINRNLGAKRSCCKTLVLQQLSFCSFVLFLVESNGPKNRFVLINGIAKLTGRILTVRL